MRLLVPFSFVLLAAFCQSLPAEPAPEDMAMSAPNTALIYAALQTRMATKHGNVPPAPSPDPSANPGADPRIKLDPAQLQREAQELLELSQSLQPDIDSLNHGLLPKDTIGKLKRIEKLSKHLRAEIAP